MNKQSGSTLSTTKNGSRSCYITAKTIACLSVERILTRTIHISNKTLNWLWTLFKNVNPLTKRRKKYFLDIQKEYYAPGTQTRIANIDNCFWREIEKFFVPGKFTRTLCFWAIHVPNENNIAIVIPTNRNECATHCSCSQNCYNCKQQKIDSYRDVWFRGNPGWKLL